MMMILLLLQLSSSGRLVLVLDGWEDWGSGYCDDPPS